MNYTNITVEIGATLNESDLNILKQLESSYQEDIIVSQAVAGLNGDNESKLTAFIRITKENIKKVVGVLELFLPRYPIFIYKKDKNGTRILLLDPSLISKGPVDTDQLIERLMN